MILNTAAVVQPSIRLLCSAVVKMIKQALDQPAASICSIHCTSKYNRLSFDTAHVTIPAIYPTSHASAREINKQSDIIRGTMVLSLGSNDRLNHRVPELINHWLAYMNA